MSINTDDEILQDFLVEAGEILELLSEQLVDLEQNPEDNDLLNAVFRSFHTIKGGAGFLSITALVDVCHRAEDVFNVLRQGERIADAELMDVILTVLDVVNSMFEQVQAGEDPTPAEETLLTQLEQYAQPGDAGEAQEPSAQADSVEQEFDAMVSAAQASDPVKAEEPSGEGGPAGEGNNISDDEFEALLDELHGKGGAPGTDAGNPKEPASPAVGNSDAISDDEFEAMLDEIHGKGGTPGATAPVEDGAAQAAAPKPEPEAAPAQPAAESKPAAKAPAKAATKKSGAGGKAAAETTVRVDTARLDRIMNMVGELVLVRNRLQTLRSAMADEEVTKAVANLDVVTSDLQLTVMKTRMQPIKKVFGRFPRVVRDLARSLEKEVDLELRGEDTDLDKNLVEALADPLVHLVRNAVDHGIEQPGDRESAGKSRRGQVVLAAEQEGDHILLSIQDDGKGMDADVLRQKAVEKGVFDEKGAARLDDKEAYNLIFAAGFSTKTEISDVSGRGVGMDVVKTRIAQMNGTVEVDSEKGKGSRMVIKVPLTLAIMPTLMVRLQEQIFALPLANVVEIFNLDLSQTNVVDGQKVILVRDKALPLFFLRDWLVSGAPPAQQSAEGHVVVAHAGSDRVGFVVDDLIGQEEVVIKPLGALLQGLAGLAGATITGDGKIALILDIPGMMQRYA